jgi:hypothetical protein
LIHPGTISAFSVKPGRFGKSARIKGMQLIAEQIYQPQMACA